MSGVRARTRKPILLLLVFGVFLVIVGITALAQAILVSTNYSQSILGSVIRDDAATVRSVADVLLTPEDLVPGSTDATRASTIHRGLGALVEPEGILRVEIRLSDGAVLWSSDQAVVGGKAGSSPDFAKALTGEASANLVPTPTSEALGDPLGASTVLREYFPIKSGGNVLAVVGLWRDAGPILTRLESIRTDVIIVTLTAGLVAAVVLFLVFRAAQGRINRQTEALIEATRRDPLTGTPNHGTLVEALAEAIEAARSKQEPISVALVDIDNFRLLNDTHGHAAGDEAILTVAELLRAEFPTGATLGRYGPDEFLVIEPSAEVLTLERAVHRLRGMLAERALQFGDSESLPVTVSAGICSFPDHAGSVTDLLSGAAITLQEAKTSGGDSVRIAGPGFDVPAEIRTFDVYQGLILAVDGKDHYTKRHSEDVARYAVFLAERIGLEPDLIATIRVAALLHDVGKIGVPDAILRKPARLSEDEFSVMKQHVALGDSIVRDLPNIELIRAGIRHHHERWDGHGYPDELKEDDIPLVARIVAVGDVFSAMTTTRPYRKALSLEEALDRLESGGRDPARGTARQHVRRGAPDGVGRSDARRGRRLGTALGAVHQGRLSAMARSGVRRRPGPGQAFLAALGAALVVLGIVGPVAAAKVWTVTASTMAVPKNVSTDVRLTITNISSGPAIGCVTVEIPTAQGSVSAVAVVSVSRGLSWSAARSTSLPGIIASAGSSADRLLGSPEVDQLKLDVTVVGKTGPAWSWTASAFQNIGCTSKSAAVLIPMTIVALPTLVPTDTPTPRPSPTPTPTPIPTLAADPDADADREPAAPSLA